MSNVYWAPYAGFGFSEMVFPEPERLLPALNTPLFLETDILRCPSFTGHLKNTFVIKSPIDIEIGWDEHEQRWRTNWNDERANIFLIRHPEYQVFTLTISYLFASEDEDMNVEIRPATYSHNEFTQKTAFVGGDMCIGKYLRSTDCAFILRPEYKRVKIKIGDPLFYATFKSKNDTKIKMNKFYITNEIAELINHVDNMKRNRSFTVLKLHDYYNMYVNRGYKKRALKLIKENILD